MQIEHVRQRLRAYGAKPSHEEVLLRAWTQALPLGSGRQLPENFSPCNCGPRCPGAKRSGVD
jgi:23S rRNA (adenine2503-C2)-methyltransferase